MQDVQTAEEEAPAEKEKSSLNMYTICSFLPFLGHAGLFSRKRIAYSLTKNNRLQSHKKACQAQFALNPT